MSVTLRGRIFHYRFRIKGKDYSGPCHVQKVPKEATPAEIEAIKKAAVQFENAERERIVQELRRLEEADREIRMNKSVVALVENYKFELTGGKRIHFREAFALAAAKPARRIARSTYAALRETYWNDFSSFMEATYPDIQDLSAVRRAHCEAYVAYLAEHGRFDQEVRYALHSAKRKRPKEVTYTTELKLSGKTIKEIVGVCRWVFSRLEEDAGIVRDPWKEVIIPVADVIRREIFTYDELQLIESGMQENPFCRHLFLIAANSGLTEGDICTLKWSDIDWTAPGGGCLCRQRRKTGSSIMLPLLPQLREYLRSLPRTGEYISPVHAEMYLNQQSSVSARVKQFLNGLGIETTVQIEGHRAQSVKDLHSMRHIFCYRAKRAGIPESSIKKFVGHKVLVMTQHYADHDTIADLAEDIKKLPALFGGGEDIVLGDPRKELANLAYSLPVEQVRALLAQAVVVGAIA